MQTPFGIRELAERAKREGATDLAQGVINTSPPPALLAAYSELAVETASTYNNKRGVPAFREAVASYLTARGWAVKVEQVLGTAGVMGATVAALLCDLRPGDTVLLPEPFFIGHKLMLEALGFNVRYINVPLDNPPHWDELRDLMQDASALLLTTPANPTGQVTAPATTRELSETAVKTGCLLVLDEVYREFKWQEASPDDTSYDDLDLSKTVIARSFSKTFAIPGWRVGFAVTTPERAERMAMQHDALYIGGSTLAQHILAAALTKSREQLAEYVINLRMMLSDNRAILADAFQSFGMDPLPVPAGYYMLLKHNRESDMAAMEELMAKKVAVTPASILFSDPEHDTGYVRIHFAAGSEAVRGVAQRLGG
jgi:aspartate/methionine/tyrosine aminotransferase